MAIGTVALQLGLVDKSFQSGLKKATNQIKSTVNVMKNMVIGAKIGSYLFSGAEQAARENLKMIQTEMSALASGFSQEMVNGLKPLIEKFDFLGVAADTASDSLYKFILTGRSMSLQTLGVYLDKDTQAMLTAMTAAERYQWAIANIPNHIQNITDKLDPATKAFYEFQKRSDDVKKSLGTAFTGTLMGIVDAFGGVNNAMKAAIIAFTAYKTAMIIGNVAIGISKAIAMGSVFSAPIAIAMGAAALGSIFALIGGASVAINALNNVPPPSSSQNGSSTNGSTNVNVNVQQTTDRYGQVSRVLNQKSGGLSSNVQTHYGSNQ